MDLMFYSVWAEITDRAHKLIRKVFTEINSEDCLAIELYGTRGLLQPQVSPPGGHEKEIRFTYLQVGLTFQTLKLSPFFYCLWT